MDMAMRRAQIFVTVFFLAALSAFLIFRRVTIADRLVSLDETTRQEAIGDLRKLDDPAKSRLVRALLLSLVGKEPSERRYAAEALGRLGPLAWEAVPALTAALGNDDDILRFYAAATLKKIGTPAALKALETKAARGVGKTAL
jgi:HEAT repeat protein